MATTPIFGWDKPVVGADADAWGTKLNDIFDDQDSQLASTANTIRGNNTGSTAAPLNLTPAQVQAMLPAVVGASQGGAGTKGAVPQPTATQQNRVLGGDGTWRAGLGRSFGATITTTGVNGSQPTFTNGLNVASVSVVSAAGGVGSFTVTLTNAVTDNGYQVALSGSGALMAPGGTPLQYGAKTTTTIQITFAATSGEVSLSGF